MPPMPQYWMISNRTLTVDAAGVPNGFGSDQGSLTYWTSNGPDLTLFENWTKTDHDTFRAALAAAADSFPSLLHSQNEDQKHVTFMVHGYNVDWTDAAKRYQQLCGNLFSGSNSLGICVSFDWPSKGSILGYLPDREEARSCADDLATTLSELYSWMLAKQQATELAATAACKAKLSVITHSMGNYLFQKAMSSAWCRINKPLSSSLINQLVMIAADVDNDLFETAADDGLDGDAIANLCYRVTSLYSGRDAVLGVSAGLKHFGTRRLGRSGLAIVPPTGKDNVWDVDCSSFFPATISAMEIHSAYFEQPAVIELVRRILVGVDRNVLVSVGQTIGSAWPPKASIVSS